MANFKMRMDDELKLALKTYAKSQGTTMTDVADAALREFLDPDDYRTASLHHLSELNRKLNVVLRRDETILETLGRFILVYLLHTPPLPEREAQAAKREARARYDNFTERLAQSLSRNKTFLRAVVAASPSPEDLYYSYRKANDDT